MLESSPGGQEIVLSEGHRTDMLPDMSGLGQQEKITLYAPTRSEHNFQKVADALVLQHVRWSLSHSCPISISKYVQSWPMAHLVNL